ncbi:MAG: tetratricopeptide repeat protein [Planctomycetota bacterium]
MAISKVGVAQRFTGTAAATLPKMVAIPHIAWNFDSLAAFLVECRPKHGKAAVVAIRHWPPFRETRKIVGQRLLDFPNGEAMNRTLSNSPVGFLALLVGLTVCLSAAQVLAQAEPQASESASESRIRELIEKLGSDSYATRIRARNQLRRYGLEAFDALREAQDHEDSEILAAARYLISSLQVSWSKESDPREVRELLFEYGAQSDADRLSRIELLGRLPGRAGAEALARLARFEPTPMLSRQAALLLLKQPLEGDTSQLSLQADRIESVLHGNQRDSSTWLLAYAADLRDGQFNVERWLELVRKQRSTVDSGSNHNISSESVLELVRILAGRAIEEGNRDAALKLAADNVDLVSSDTSDLADHCQWAIRGGLYSVVIALYERNLHPFGRNAGLSYSVAQAFAEMGEQKKAQERADHAFGLNPFPPREDKEEDEDEDSVVDRKLVEIGEAHLDVGRQLYQRGCFEWYDREIREVIDHCGIESMTGVRARREIAFSLTERMMYDKVTDVLTPIVERLEKDAQYSQRLLGNRISVDHILSTFHFADAMVELKRPDRIAIAKELFQQAYREDPRNIDILIKMFRIDPENTTWMKSIRNLIAQDLARRERRIAQYELDYKRSRDGRILAEELNQFAWLVANTEGDFEKALKSSLRSLELTDDTYPDDESARLDTCGRCYFALGRFEEAIKTQRKALKLAPHSPPMVRQLAEFEAAQKAAQQATDES